MDKKIEVKATTPLRWPNGWSRTLIDQRRTQGAWKKSGMHYLTQIEQELARMGVSSVEISRNEPSKERLDPGNGNVYSLKQLA
jgi:hypothetical protein